MASSVKKYHTQKRGHARHSGIPFDLTVSDVYVLLHMARIHITDVGKKSDSYALARFNDEGGYTRGNCRFITQRENAQERTNNPPKHWSVEAREAARIRAKKQGLGIKVGIGR